MTDKIVVFCTVTDHAEAKRLAHAIVGERLAACVNILPKVESVYRWQGAVETATELLLVIKTSRSRFDELKQRLFQMHSYDVPEVIALPIVDGAESYLEWLGEQVT